MTSTARRARLLQFTVDPYGGLRIAPIRPNCSIELVLRSQHAEVQYTGWQPVALSWSEFGNAASVVGSHTDSWSFTFWSIGGRSGPIGIGLGVTGHVESACHDIIVATSTPLRRFDQWQHSGYNNPGRRLPLAPRHFNIPSPYREITTLSALGAVVARNPERLERLADPARVSRLATDISNGMFNPVAPKGGMRRDTIDILVALRKAGFFHPLLGRPVMREQLPAPDAVVVSVRTQLDANPFRKGRHTDDATIMRVVRAAYLDVEPWPFAALFD